MFAYQCLRTNNIGFRACAKIAPGEFYMCENLPGWGFVGSYFGGRVFKNPPLCHLCRLPWTPSLVLCLRCNWLRHNSTSLCLHLRFCFYFTKCGSNIWQSSRSRWRKKSCKIISVSESKMVAQGNREFLQSQDSHPVLWVLFYFLLRQKLSIPEFLMFRDKNQMCADIHNLVEYKKSKLLFMDTWSNYERFWLKLESITDFRNLI